MGCMGTEISRQPEWKAFLQFSEAVLAAWQQRAIVVNRYAELKRGFDAWKRNTLTSAGSCRALLLHSFSHLLITAVALECGYTASSILERDYAIPQVGFGILLYTASSDAEGMLGGLISPGRRAGCRVDLALPPSPQMRVPRRRDWFSPLINTVLTLVRRSPPSGTDIPRPPTSWIRAPL
jgi:hypothetical protein